jgi:hypothetical protein
MVCTCASNSRSPRFECQPTEQPPVLQCRECALMLQEKWLPPNSHIQSPIDFECHKDLRYAAENVAKLSDTHSTCSGYNFNSDEIL